MMCNPCFMDANQVGYVHELTLDEVKKILDDSISFKPRRQMSGAVLRWASPRCRPHFLEACRLREEGRLHDGPGRHQRPALRPRARVRLPGEGGRASTWSYLQFDGVTNEANSHRQITNLFDVKKIAIDNLYAGGHQDHAGGHHRERAQQRERRTDRRLLHGEPRPDGRARLPARLVHRPRRGDRRRGAPSASATRRRTSRTSWPATTTAGSTPYRDWFPLGSASRSPRSPTT